MSFDVYKDIFTEVFPHFSCLLGQEQSISCRIPIDCFSLYCVYNEQGSSYLEMPFCSSSKITNKDWTDMLQFMTIDRGKDGELRLGSIENLH